MSTLHGRASSGIPERIGKYEIRQELGKGGFGQVFLGFDPTVGRQVAIKVLSSDGDPNSLRRFRHEASAAGNLHHKNIVTIHEFGEDNGTFYIAMEYLEGQDLQHFIGSPSLSMLDKVRIMSEAAEGLQCAHRSGIVHRDVKPANIMVLSDGSVKLMDFGIARLTRDHSTRLTETGFLIGSVFYMAPEQLNGQEIDARCDIWSFGAIYYELLSGRHPFEAPDVASAIVRIMQNAPKPIEILCPECPKELAAVVARLLSKDREARYQNFEELLFDTAPILLDLESHQAKKLVGQASDLIRKGELDTAQSLVKKILVHDPAHEQGRALWQQLQSEVRFRSIRLRAQTLIEQADKAASARDYAAAIEAIETAVRVDPANSTLPARLTELRAAKQRSDLASGLLSSARENLHRDNLSMAFELLGDALSAEPDNSEAQRLLGDVQNKIAERDAQKRIRDGLTKANGLVALQSFDEAIAILEDLSRQAPKSEQVRAGLELALRERQEYDRKRFIQTEFDAAKKEVKSNQFEAAIARLEPLVKQSQGQGDIASLLAYARSELEAAKHLAKIRAAAEGAWKLLKAQEFDKALAEVEAALLKYEDDPALLRLRQTIVKERDESEQARFVQQVLAESAELECQERVAEACETLERAQQRYNSDPALTDALAHARQKAVQHKERTERERAQFVQRALTESAELEHNDRLEQAGATLEKALQHYGAEPSLTDALARLRQKAGQLKEHAERERLQFIQQALTESAELERQERVAEACASLERALQRYNAEPSLTDALARARQKAVQLKERAERERAQSIQQALAESAELERNGRVQQACAALESALQRYQPEPRLADALAGMRLKLIQQQKRERVEREKARFVQGVLAEAAELDRSGRLEEACATLEKALQRQQVEPSLTDALARTRQKQIELLKERAEREHAQLIRQVLAEAEELERNGRVRQACETLEKALQRYQSESSLADALTRLRQRLIQQEEQERSAALDRDLRQADTLIIQGQPLQATQLLSKMKAAYPGEDRVFSLLNRAQEEERRRANLDRLLAEVQRLLDANQPDQACDLLARGGKEFEADPRFISLAASAKKALARKGALDRARMAFQARNWRAASDALDIILQQEPNDAEARRLLDQVRDQERTDLRRNRIETGRMEAEKLIRGLQFQEASVRLRKLLDEFPDEQSVHEDLARALEAIERQSRREAYAQGRKRAEGFLKGGQYQAAIGTLEEMARQFPDDPILKEELSAARETSLEHDRRERYASGRRKAVDLTQARKLREAIAVFEGLLLEFPGDSVLQEDLKSARGALELQEQREHLDREVALLEKLYRKGDARGIKERASALSSEVQDARVRELLEWASAELQRPPQESGRESAEALIRKRKRKNIGAAVIVGGLLAAIPVAFLLRPRPAPEKLIADPDRLSFNFQPGAPAAPQTLRVRGGAKDGAVSWSAVVSDDWLSVNPSRGGPQQQTTVSVDPNHMAPGTHSGYVLITSEDGAQHARTTVTVAIPSSASPVPVSSNPQSELKPPEQAPPAPHKSTIVPGPPAGRGGQAAVSPASPKTDSRPQSTADSKVENQAVAVPPALRPAGDCGPTYHRRTNGRMTWTSGVGLEKGAELVIGGLRQNLAGGEVDNNLPGCPVEVSSQTKGIDVFEQPSLADGYHRVALRNNSPGPIPQIEITWKIK